MTIGIDASRAFIRQKTGIEEYSYQVIKRFCKFFAEEKIILYIKKNQKVDFDLPPNWKIKEIRWPIFWTQAGLSLEVLFHPVDVLFIPSHVVPFIHPQNTVVTVHGLEYEMAPEAYSSWQRLYMRWSIKMSCRWAKRIISVSKNTRQDLIKLYGVPEEKIFVVHEGTSENFKFESLNSKSSLNDKVLNYKPYLLFVGRLEKRKNIEGIIEAYKILKEKYDIPHSLVLVGSPGYGYKIIKFKIRNYKLKIIQMGYVDESTKWRLIKNADVFLFPTFYEGFGLPILEAQKMGVPVVASNVSSVPEVAGDGAAYCNPKEPISIADSIYSLIKDTRFRNEIIEKGYENVKRFSWDKCASSITNIMLMR